jgi:hypothetical protein
MVFPQLAKRAVRPVGGSREHVADLNLAVGDHYAVDEQLGQQPPLLERGGGQPGADGLAECLDPVGDGAEFQLLLGRGIQLALLGEQRVAASVQVLALAVQFRQWYAHKPLRPDAAPVSSYLQSGFGLST